MFLHPAKMLPLIKWKLPMNTVAWVNRPLHQKVRESGMRRSIIGFKFWLLSVLGVSAGVPVILASVDGCVVRSMTSTSDKVTLILPSLKGVFVLKAGDRSVKIMFWTVWDTAGGTYLNEYCFSFDNQMFISLMMRQIRVYTITIQKCTLFLYKNVYFCGIGIYTFVIWIKSCLLIRYKLPFCR